MSSNLYLVFTEPPNNVSSEEWEQWQISHAQENLESTGMISAQRYKVEPIIAGQQVEREQFSGDTDQLGAKFLTLYEFSGDVEDLRQHLLARWDSGDIVLPSFYGGISFMTWNCQSLGERLTPKGQQP